MGVVVLSAVVTGAALYPRDVAAAANPTQPPASMRSTWIVADVSRALIYYLGGWGFAAFLLLGAVMVLLPMFDRSPERRLRKRPIVAGLGVVFFLGFVIAWAAGWQMRYRPVAESTEFNPYVQPVTAPGPALPALAPTVPVIPPAPPAAPPGGTPRTGGGR